MTQRSAWPDATDLHAAFAPVHALLAERRALYRLAAELCAPDGPPPAEAELDNPLFRFRIGEALAGRESFDIEADDRIADLLTPVGGNFARLGLVSGATANERLARMLSLIHAQSGAQGNPPRLLTEADGVDFREAADLVEAGIATAYAVSPRLAEDVLPHSSVLAVLDPATSQGMVSASSRLFPGLILIDRPSRPYDVAEALIHEGAHQKFFDLAITRDFLGADISNDDVFHPSWSAAVWPVEQVLAAFHAYACMAQFAEDVQGRGETHLLGAGSLLMSARERELEIGRWLLSAEASVGFDGRWLVRSFLGEENLARETRQARSTNGSWELDPRVRVARPAGTGRVLLARAGNPPALFWLDARSRGVLDHLGEKSKEQNLDSAEAAALANLVASALVRPIGSP